ncbi:MAG: amidohydrolase [Thermomicrobiaceae bacterium]
MSADIIFMGGHILDGSRTPSDATAVAIHQGRIAHVGTDSEALKWRNPGTQVVELNGRTIAPAFNDAHCHIMSVGFAAREIDAHTPPNRTIQQIVDRVAERARNTEAGLWVIARGYDQARLDDQRHPTRDDLDPVSPDNPVLIVRACGHISVANSKALEAAGIDAQTPAPEGGTIDRDSNGRPTGVLREEANKVARRSIPNPTVDEIREALLLAGQEYYSRGVTSAAEAGICSADEMAAYTTLRNENRLPLRSYLMMMIDDRLEELRALGIRTGFGDDMLRIGPAKIFLDGSIGGRTARMSQPYDGEDDNLGLWMQDPQLMKQKLIDAHLAGFQCCAHAIGDAAIDLLLSAFEEALEQEPRADHRHRIEHSSILRPDLLDRIQRIGAVPIPGTSFLHAFQRAYVANLGMDRIRYAYAMREFLNRGIVAAASTDAPVVSTSAMIGIQTMMTRLSEEGEELYAEEKITLEEAVHAYTWAGAYASFEENIKGTLEPGKVGDVVVLETDLRGVNPNEMAGVNVDTTVMNGEIVYQRDSSST